MHITSLPVELITAIHDHLPAGSLFSIRQACRRLEHVTAKLFRKRYYQELFILVTPRNLEFLRFVANQETLRHSVRAVYIFPSLWESWKDLKEESFDYYNGRKSREMVPPRLAQDRFQAYRQILNEHLELINTNRLQDRLMEVFGRFPNLDTVGLANRSPTRDNNTRPEPLRCIDWLDIKRRTGQDPALPADENLMGMLEYRARMKVLMAMLTAVSVKSISLRSLTSCQGEHGSLGPEILATDVLSNALRNVRHVHLCWTWYMKSKTGHRSNAMGQILSAASASVEKLHWGTASKGIAPRGDGPYHRLPDDIHLETLPAGTGPKDAPQHAPAYGIRFRRLAELKLSSLLLSFTTLPMFFSSTLSTLRRLGLSQIQLGRTKSAIEGSIRWRRVFNHISEHIDLEYVDLTRLGHAGIYWTLMDPVHGVNAVNSLTTRNDHAVWDKSKAKVGMKEWMHNVRFDIRPGDAYSIEDPGSHVLGEDLEMDAWVRSCLNG